VVAEKLPPKDFAETPSGLTRFLDAAEEHIRKRVAKVRFLERLFLLDRDWLTRMTMLMIVFSILWGAIGGADAFTWRTQVTAFAIGQNLPLSNQEAYAAITLHGIRMLFGFAQQLEMAIFGVLLVTALGLKPRYKWTLYSSVALLNVGLLLMQGPFYLYPQFNDNFFPALGWYFYPPLGIRGLSDYVASPLWYLGWVLMCAAMLLWSAWMILHLRSWWLARGGTAAPQRLPAFVLFILAAIVLIPISYVTVLASVINDIGAYLGVMPMNALLVQVVFWMFGHGIVYILFLIPIVAYYFLVPIFARRPIYSYRFAFVAAVMFTILTPLLAIHHLYLTPLPTWSDWVTQALSFLIIIPSAITFFTVWMTTKGVKARDWEWNAVTLFLLLSFAGSIAGGLTGPDNATPAFDIDIHNTLFIVSHFHALVLLSITAGGFALAYALLPVLVGRLWYSPRLAQAHFVLSAIGMSGMVVFMDLLGEDGILRRSFIFPRSLSVDNTQLALTGFVVIALVAQLFFALNAVLTVFRGRLLSTTGLSLDETLRRIAASTHPRPTVPIDDPKFVRGMPRARREGAERAWTTVVTVLVIAVIVATTPITLSTANNINSPPNIPAGGEAVSLVGHEYYWSVNESGPVNGSFDNVIVVRAGQWVGLTATATDATQDFYIPFRSLPTVDVQVIPGSTSYNLFQAPSSPGVYGVPNGEYNGPWFGQDVSVLIVLPASGGPSAMPALSSGAGDNYNPPVMSAASADLVSDNEGLFNSSAPGPTLTAAPGNVSFQWTVPMSSIGIDNYLVNVTSNDPSQQQDYVSSLHDVLPYTFGIYRLGDGVGQEPVTLQPLVVGSTQTTRAFLAPGAYLYGLTTPVAYSYDPDGQAGFVTGQQTGSVMGLWGVLWVS
jgi:terminal oxidase heme-binding subunit I